MKKIMITVALVAVTMAANAQDVKARCVPDNTPASLVDGFTNNMLEENYSYVELENMLLYAFNNILAKYPNNSLISAYKVFHQGGMFQDQSNIETMLTTLYNKYPKEVKKAKKQVDMESFWDF